MRVVRPLYDAFHQTGQHPHSLLCSRPLSLFPLSSLPLPLVFYPLRPLLCLPWNNGRIICSSDVPPGLKGSYEFAGHFSSSPPPLHQPPSPLYSTLRFLSRLVSQLSHTLFTVLLTITSIRYSPFSRRGLSISRDERWSRGYWPQDCFTLEKTRELLFRRVHAFILENMLWFFLSARGQSRDCNLCKRELQRN